LGPPTSAASSSHSDHPSQKKSMPLALCEALTFGSKKCDTPQQITFWTCSIG